MGNPNGDLFIKTISWLFVVPASHGGATGGLGIITSSFGALCSDHMITLSECMLSHFY